MIAYNQEKYIRAALDSLLAEQEKPYEIVIGDDLSTDGTRRILKEYQKQYPEIIKLVLNDKNLGIFENFNKVASQVSGDIISVLAGDDWYKPNLLENMNKKIEEQELDPLTMKFILLPHVVLHLPDGSERIQKNSPGILAKYSPVGSVLRGKLITRHIGLSRALFEQWPLFEPDANEIGLWADLVHHVLLTQHVEKMVVMDCVGPVYRAGVGISAKTERAILDRSYLAALSRIQDYYFSKKLNLSKADSRYLEFLIECRSMGINPDVRGIKRALSLALKLLKLDRREMMPVAREMIRASKRIVSSGFRSWRPYMQRTHTDD